MFIKGFVFNPYPAIPPNYMRTLHPGIRPTKTSTSSCTYNNSRSSSSRRSNNRSSNNTESSSGTRTNHSDSAINIGDTHTDVDDTYIDIGDTYIYIDDTYINTDDTNMDTKEIKMASIKNRHSRRDFFGGHVVSIEPAASKRLSNIGGFGDNSFANISISPLACQRCIAFLRKPMRRCSPRGVMLRFV